MKDVLINFENKSIRRVCHNNKWYFVVIDIVVALTDTSNPSDYIKKIKKRDAILNKGWGQIVTPLLIETTGGKQRLNCTDVEGCFRIVQSIPSPKAEPMKMWLAHVGYERLQEYEDPSLAVDRARKYYKKLGRSEAWIQQRILGQNIRNKLTDYWSEHEIKEGREYAILTDIIHKEWSDMTVRQHKKLKNLENQNLRDHMTDAELVFTALAELSTKQIAEQDNAVGMKENRKAAKKGGGIAKKARKDLENKIGKKVVSSNNFLNKHTLERTRKVN